MRLLHVMVSLWLLAAWPAQAVAEEHEMPAEPELAGERVERPMLQSLLPDGSPAEAEDTNPGQPRAWRSDAEAMSAIALKLRVAVGAVKTRYPRNAQVVLEAALFPNGRVLFPRVARSSGDKALDERVLRALRRAEPLPVPPSVSEGDAAQIIRLVFRPSARS